MRWFRGHADAPRLLSLSPLHAEEELLQGASLQLHPESPYTEMSPVRWVRRKSSSSESERNCYNVQTSRVTTERSVQKKDKKRIQEERRRSCEKRNPLLDRVKNTRLSFFRGRDPESGRKSCEDADGGEHDDEDDEEHGEGGEEEEEENDEEDERAESAQSRSMSELRSRALTRNEFRRSVCEIDLKQVVEREKMEAKRKRRCKSQSRLPSRKSDSVVRRIAIDETESPGKSRWSRSEDGKTPRKEKASEASRSDSMSVSGCLAAKFRAMQDRCLKSSTSKLIAKIYRKDAKDRDKRRLRSFSYGTLPGLDELRTNPLYNEQEQDDNDSGILDNGSATSSLLEDRCPASSSPTTGEPPELPPRTSRTRFRERRERGATETRLVRLNRESEEQCLGIFIAKTGESSPGYLVARIVPNGLADREGTLRLGDEILLVNGKRLRGLGITEARRILGDGSPPGEVDILLSRKVELESPNGLRESSVDYENVSLRSRPEDRSPRSHFRKHNSSRSANSHTRRAETEKNSGGNSGDATPGLSNFCTLPRRPRSTLSTFHTVVFEKGHGKKSLGFTIVGGRDSPKGSIGIFIKSVLPGGQAAEDGRLRAGDEILAVNGQVSHDLTHREAVQLFRTIKSGSLALHICRRVKSRDAPMPKAKSCADLLLVDS